MALMREFLIFFLPLFSLRPPPLFFSLFDLQMIRGPAEFAVLWDCLGQRRVSSTWYSGAAWILSQNQYFVLYKLTACYFIQLKVVGGLDLVDDESKPERRPTKHMPTPAQWTNVFNPALSYDAYYCYANLYTLNKEAWMMPFAFCTREKKWCEFAEPVNGELVSPGSFCKYNMVIVSPILERDLKHEETIWNAAVVIGNHGNIIGSHRKSSQE